MTLNIKEKRIIYQVLVLIMKADLIIKEEETAYLDRVFCDFELSIDEFDHMDDINIDYLAKEFATFDVDKKNYANKLFVEMANCDGYADPRELKIIDSLI